MLKSLYDKCIGWAGYKNANKILALKPIRNSGGVIEHLELITLKNREQERLNCRLDVDQRRNGRII